MKNYILSLVALSVVLGGGYYLKTQQNKSADTASQTETMMQVDTMSSTSTPSTEKAPKVMVASVTPTTKDSGVTLTATFKSATEIEVKGAYTMAQVQEHNNAQSCFTAINGSVYDLTNWVSKHPGGKENILSICGKDGSAAFNGQHGGDTRPENTLKTYFIGTLVAQ